MKKLIIVILLVTLILVGCTTNELINKTDTEELVFQPYLEIQKNSSISLGIHNVPEGYMVPAKQQGKVVRFDYMTNTYDYQDRVMKKYAYVYIPYGYETSTERYDVVYTMHGHTGDVTSFPGELDDLTDIKRMFVTYKAFKVSFFLNIFLTILIMLFKLLLLYLGILNLEISLLITLINMLIIIFVSIEVLMFK